MKKIFSIIILSTILISCSDKGKIEDVGAGGIKVDTLIVNDDNCGQRTFAVTFDDNENNSAGHFYILLLKKKNSQSYISYGTPKSSALNTNIQVYSSIFYFDPLVFDQQGVYEFWVLKYNYSDVAYLGDFSYALGAGGPYNLTISSFGDYQTLYSQCCNYSRTRYKAQVVKDLEDYVGDKVKAKITTRYGTLCGEQYNSTKQAMSGAWVGLNREYKVGGQYLQLGYKHLREKDSSFTYKELYVEYTEYVTEGPNEGDFRIMRPDLINPPPPPLEGAEHQYEIEFEPSNGDLLFYYDSILLFGLSHPLWKDSAAFRYVMWAGEIQGYETDMGGTQADSLSFTNCGYSVLGYDDYVDANLQFNAESATLDPDQWGVQYIQNELWIWDKNRL